MPTCRTWARSLHRPEPSCSHGPKLLNATKSRPLGSSQSRLLHHPGGVVIVLLLHGGRGLATAGPGHLEAAVSAPELDVLLLGRSRRVQVDDEGEDVGGEDEGDDPLEDCGGVVVVCCHAGGEGHGEDDLDEHEGELDPKGDAEDAVLAVTFSAM